MGQRVRLVRGVVAAVALASPLLLGASPASAAAPGETISSYDVTMTVDAKGGLHVREEIAYDFGTNFKHGIFRTLPTTQRYNDKFNRSYPLTNLKVTSPDGAPTMTEVTREDTTTIKVGDPNQTITGPHTYVLDYDIGGSLNDFADHQELYWNAIGAEWGVPITSATATVELPADVNRVTCFTGAQSSKTKCESSSMDGRNATFRQSSMAPYQALTVVAGMPAGSVPSVKPILVERWSLAQAFAPSPLALGGLAASLLLVAGGIWWLVVRRGRDRRYAGQVPGLAPAAGQAEVEEFRPLFTRPDGAVEFTPPDGVRPGQVGTLIDEKADVVDVTATIVDLAVRRYIHIEELPPSAWSAGPDWRFSVSGKPDNTLLPYERMLLGALFRGGNVVCLSQLRDSFSGSMTAVRNQLYDDVVREGWYARRPDSVRSSWTGIGIGVLVGGAALTLFLAIFTHLALIGLGVVIGGIALTVCAGRMPARTARGSAALARVLGFGKYLRTAEVEQLKFEERELILSRYLPYAMVFGETERLARAFASLNANRQPGAGLYWYSGPGVWDLNNFGAAMTTFTVLSATSLVSTPPMATSSSSFGSSGFSGGGSSGGGGGGGGGGSW